MTGEMAEIELNSAELFDEQTVEMAKFLLSLPEKDPLADIEAMHRNLGRALSCAEDGRVMLFEGEIKHWITCIDQFLKEQRSRES